MRVNDHMPLLATELPPDAGTDSEAEDRGDRGFVAAWFALMLTVFVGMAGFATDLGYWYLTASRAQNAADASALAGVVFLPTQLSNATTTANTIAGNHGFTSVNIQQVRSNQLRVTVTKPVPTFFVRLFGINNVTIQRTALAEFEQPVAMGSPDPNLGNDPETGYSPQFWLNIAGSLAYKSNGDRFHTKTCGTSGNISDYQCSGSSTPNNQEYGDGTAGYFFGVKAKGGETLRIQIFDPVYANVGNACASNMLSAAQITTLTAWYPDAATRYAKDLTSYCTGDANIGPGASTPVPETVVIVRQPGASPNETDHAVEPQCTPRRYKGYPLSGSGQPTMYQLLHPSDGVQDSEAVVNSDATTSFAEGFRRWVTVCDINNSVAGEYIVQVRTNASSTDPLAYNSANDAVGMNRFSFRAGKSNGSGVNGSGYVVYARGRMPIYANNGATSFKAARVLPGGRGRVLKFELFDMGDASASGTLQFKPPTDSNYSNFTGCVFTRSDSASLTYNGSTCTLSNVSSSLGYNGRLITATIPIPDDYTCTASSETGCWVTVQPQFSGGSVNDVTTWAASMQGDPVRLIQ